MPIHESGPDPIEIAEAQLRYLELVEGYVSAAASELLLSAQTNARRLSEAAPEDTQKISELSLEKLTGHFAPQGLELFSLGGNARATFSVPPERSVGFLRSLLTSAAQERARLDFLTDRAQVATVEDDVESVSDEPTSDTADDIPESWGVLDGSVQGSLWTLDSEESRLHDFHRANELLAELEQLLTLRHPQRKAWRDSIQSLGERGRKLIREGFEADQNGSRALTAAISDAVSKAFDDFAPSVSTEGRKAYAGIIMGLLGLTRGSSDPDASYERVKKSVQRGAGNTD